MRYFAAIIAAALAFGQTDTDQLLEKARDTALHYSASLPNFLCTEMVSRYEDPRGDNRWNRIDVLTVKLTYFQHGEDYKLIEVDGKPTVLDFMNTGGPISKGEFGSLLLLLFHPQSETAFHWKGWSNFHKHRVAVYTYHIEKQHSQYRVAYGRGEAESILAPYHGEVYVEPESGQILHLDQHAELPPGFPMKQASTSIDYDYAEVGGHRYVLPARADVRMGGAKYRVRNQVEFKDYRKFQTEATITFDK